MTKAEIKIEVDGFCNTIREYCDDGTVLNHFIQLKKALDNNDIESIKKYHSYTIESFPFNMNPKPIQPNPIYNYTINYIVCH